MVLWQGFFRKYAKTTQKTTKFTTWIRFIWTTFALTKLFNCLRLLLYVQIQSPNAAKNKAPSDDGALFFATFGDGAKNFFAPLSMPRGSPPIIPRGSAFRICLRQIHGSRRRAGARVRGVILSANSRMTGPKFLRDLETGQKNFSPLLMPRGSAPIIPRGSAFRICRWQIHGNNTVTDIYIRYDYKNVDRANRNIIDFVNSDEEEY